MKFTYTAITKEGKTLQGTAEATDKETLIATLHRQGARPLVVKADTSKEGSFLTSLNRGKKVKLNILAAFTRQLSTMVSAGVPLTRAFATLQAQTEHKYFKQVITGLTKDVEGGTALGDAFEKYPKIFSDVYVNMVRAGEAGGILDEILKRLATQLEQDSSMRKKIKSAMTYPLVILCITILAFFGIMFFVIPQLSKILKDLGGENAELPALTKNMIAISSFMKTNWFIMIPAMIFGLYLLKRYISTPKGKLQFHKLLLRLPVFKTLVAKIAIARFSRTFASLMAAGVGVLDALEVTGSAMGNLVLEGELKECAKAVKNGKQLSEPMAASPHFPPLVSQMIAIGEETGQIDTILVKVADFYEEEVSTTIDGLSSIIEPIMIVVLGGMVGLIAASVMGPIASLSQNVE